MESSSMPVVIVTWEGKQRQEAQKFKVILSFIIELKASLGYQRLWVSETSKHNLDHSWNLGSQPSFFPIKNENF